MRTSHAFFSRNDVRRGLVALALGGVSLTAAAVNSGNIGRAGIGRSGNSASVGPLTNSGGSSIPVSPNVGGWTQAGNYGVPPSATPGGTMNLTMGGDVVFSGVKYPFQAGYVTPWKDLAVPALGALGTLGCSLVTGGLATVACLAIPLAAPHIYKWITDSGGRFNPNTGQLERKDPNVCQSSCFTYSVSGVAPYIGNTRDTGCTLHAAYLQSFGYSTRNFAGSGDNLCFGEYHPAGVTDWTPNTWTMSKVPRPSDPDDWLPSSMDDIAPYMGLRNPDSRVVGEILGVGRGEIPLGTPTVTGPSSIQGPEKSTNKADGSRVVERTQYNFSTGGNTITNTSNVTTYNTYNSGGQLTGTETRTETPEATTAQPEEPVTQCDKYPNTLGCTELDTPSEEIPKENREITYSAESPFGGGSCPADRHFFSGMLGRSFKAWDFAQTCSYIASYVRPVVLLLATFAAFLILMPGKVET